MIRIPKFTNDDQKGRELANVPRNNDQLTGLR